MNAGVVLPVLVWAGPGGNVIDDFSRAAFSAGDLFLAT